MAGRRERRRRYMKEKDRGEMKRWRRRKKREEKEDVECMRGGMKMEEEE